MEDAEIDLRRLFGLLHRRLKLISAIAAAAVLICFAVIALSSPSYVATTLVAFDPSSKNLLDSQLGGSTDATDHARIDGEIELLRSDALLLEVIAALDGLPANDWQTTPGLKTQLANWLGFSKPAETTDIEQHQTMLATLRRSITIQRRGLTNLVAIQAQAGDPAKAAFLANAVAQTYIADQIASKVDSLLASHEAVRSRMLEAKDEIVFSETQYNAFLRQTARQLGGSDSASAGVIDELARLSQDLKKTDDLATLLATSLQNADFAALSQALASTGASALMDQRATLVARIAGSDARSPMLAGLREQLNTLDTAISQAAEATLTDLRTQTTAILARQRPLDEALRTQVLDTNLSPEIVTQLYDLQSQVSFAQQQYQVLVLRSLELQNQSNLQIADSRVVSPALPPAAPSSPNRLLLLGLALLAGLVVGVSAAIIYESILGGFMSEEQLEATLRTRIAATIPRLQLSPSDDTLADMVITAPLSPFAEAMRRTRMMIDQTARQNNGLGRVTMVTSAVANEGKSTVALALARSYALSGQRTLLIDCDLRRPAIAEHLEMMPQAGLLELLDRPNAQTQLRSSLRQESDTGLTMILGAEGTDRPIDLLLAGTAFARLLGEARRNFDMVVLDTPAIGPVVDALYVAPHADIILLLTRWASTSQRDAKHALTSLEHAKTANARIVSVLNDKVEKRQKRNKRQPRYYEPDYA